MEGNTDQKGSATSTENTNSSENLANNDNENWGYDMYPERKGEKYQRNWFKTIIGIEGREGIAKMKCESNVYNCIQNSPIIKLLMGALKASGCEIDIRRHISCEMCHSSSEKTVTGGYDPELNQVIICQNTARNKGMVQGVLTHEMIHMFDYCHNDLDFKNIDHLACTEIRAANLAHCSFMSAWTEGTASPFNIKQAHQECVKSKALQSVLGVRKVTEEVAKEAIERVFPKCYNDLEPFGRRIRRNSMDMQKAYLDGLLYGYEV